MPKIVDVIVVGTNLCALFCAKACQQHGLSTVLLGEPPTKFELPGFDSLTPEGVQYLHHLLKSEQIEKLSQGSFSGIWRNGEFSQFESILGSGLQINSQRLKQFLWNLLEKSPVNCPLVSAKKIEFYSDYTQVETEINLNFQAYWCLDASGLESPVSKQTVEWLTQPIWIKREMHKGSTHLNRSEFISNEAGWQWLAFDKGGLVTKTEFSLNFDPLNAQQPLFNCQWYRRTKIREQRLLLVGNTAYRFDPAAGISLTQTLKSALYAANSVYKIQKQNWQQDSVLRAYERHMNNNFYAIYEPLGAFYHQLGILVF